MVDSPTPSEEPLPEQSDSPVTVKPITLAEFLESTPPNVEMSISDLALRKSSQYSSWMEFQQPDIQLHCSSDVCNGVRTFRCTEGGAKVDKNGYHRVHSLRVPELSAHN